jgi:hypothetical protein
LPGGGRRFSVASAADLEAVLDELRPTYKGDDISLCLELGVCPVGLLHGFEVEAHSLHVGLSNGAPWPWSYYDQPAIYAQASGVIAAEEAKIEREERMKNGQL